MRRRAGTECPDGAAASERVAVTRARAKPTTACKVPPPQNLPGRARPESSQKPEGDSSHRIQEQMALGRLAWDRT